MCPPAASPLAEIGMDITDKELVLLLDKLAKGATLPQNVVNYVNPYHFLPSNLPEDLWYWISSRDNRASEHGIWRAQGEAYVIFSDSFITGWKSTLEFYEGQVPYERKTDWVMQQFWMTQKGLGDSTHAKESSSLCRVFISGEPGIGHENERNSSHSNSTQLVLPQVRNDINNDSSRETEVVKDDERGRPDVAGSYLNQLVADLYEGGDFLELNDLMVPPSPSTSSDNSSCVTISSDECFDSLALLGDIDSESKRELVQKDEGRKFVSPSVGTEELIMHVASPGAGIRIEESVPTAEEIIENKLTMPYSIKNQKEGHQKTEDRPSSSCHVDKGSSSGSGDGENKADKSRMKKLKKRYLCFIPF